MLDQFSHYLFSWYTLLAVVIILVLYLPLQRLKINRDIAGLGGRAPSIKTSPLGRAL